MLGFVLVFVSFLALYYWLTRKPANFPPGPPLVPLLGSLPFIRSKNFHFFLEELREKHGPVIGLMLGSIPTVAVCGPREVEEVLKREEFQGRPDISDFENADLRKGVMFTEGSFWTEQRRFTLKNLRDFGFGKRSMENVILEEVDQFMTKLLSNKAKVQVSGLFNLPSINVLWSIMAGQGFSYEDKDFLHLLNILQKIFRSGGAAQFALLFFRQYPSFKKYFPELSGKTLDDSMRNFFQKTIKEHRETRKPDVNRDFIDVYLSEIQNHATESGSSFNQNTMQAVCRDLFAAGAESVGNTLGFCLMYLVLYPDWQRAVFSEIEEVIGSRQPSLDDKLRLPKVEAFLSEVLRSNPIAPLTVPHKTIRDTTLSGYNIPENSVIHVSLWAVLQDKQHWGDPEQFRPDRFLDEEGKYKKDPWLNVFGAGKRLCLGESLARTTLFIFFTSLVQKYEFSIPPGQAPPSTICLPGLTTAPQPFEVALRERQ